MPLTCNSCVCCLLTGLQAVQVTRCPRSLLAQQLSSPCGSVLHSVTCAFPLLQVLDDALEAEQAEQQRLAEDHRETMRALRSQAASTAEVLMSALDSERQQVATLEVSPSQRRTGRHAASSLLILMWRCVGANQLHVGGQLATTNRTASAGHTAARHPRLWWYLWSA